MSKSNAILLMVVALLAIILTGCGDSPRSRSVLCFLEESFIACQDKEIQDMLPEPVNGIDGQDGATGPQGETGPKGETGEKGDKGEQGNAGQDGINGIDGADGTQVEVIFPCGEDSIRHGEIILKINNQFIAYFQNIVKQGGANSPVNDIQARLTVLEENTLYMLTDGSQCKFRIVDGNIIVE
jgi:hypothetical protein